VHIYLGSSGWIGYTLPHDFKTLYFSPFDDKRDVTIMSSQAIGLSYNWALDRFYGDEKKELGDGIYTLVDQQLAEIPAGSEGVFATPWFYGERPPLFGRDARGNFLGLGAIHDRRHMTRAVMEGVCYQLRMGAEYNLKEKGRPLPKKVRAIGGGSCSGIWMQILADVLNIEVGCLGSSEATALGTAVWGAVAAGCYPTLEEASAKMKLPITKTYYPDPARVEAYEAIYRRYVVLYDYFARENDVMEFLFNTKHK
jgi:sugar (pentulose or hexulose) kinase